MHDGSIATLDEVIDHYAAGGRTISGRYAGVGSENPLKSILIVGFELTPLHLLLIPALMLAAAQR